jgi:hypothetical protein
LTKTASNLLFPHRIAIRSFEKRKRTPEVPKYLTTEEITAFLKAINDLSGRVLFPVIYHHVARGKGGAAGQSPSWMDRGPSERNIYGSRSPEAR